MRLPSTDGKWSVRHALDYFADIIGTKNLDFSKPGFIALARNSLVLKAHTGSDHFGIVLSVCADNNQYYITTSRGYWSLTFTNNEPVFTELNNTGNPTATNGADGIIFNGLYHASGTTMVHSFDGTNTWTSHITGLSVNYPHPLCSFENKVQIAVADGNTVKLYDTSYSLQQTLLLPTEYIVTTMRWDANNLYVGTRNISGGGARMFVWGGNSSDAGDGWPVYCDWIYSLEPFDGSIAAAVSSGRILRFGGGGFTSEFGHFPVFDTEYSWISNASVASGFGKILNRGMKAVGTELLLNIDGSIRTNDRFPGSFLADQPSGLWCLDQEVGLYHRAGLNYTVYSSKTITEVDSGFLVFGSDHNAETGDPVFISSIGTLSGPTAHSVYYVIKGGDLTIKLALSPADALAHSDSDDRSVAISGVSGGATAIFYSANSYGATQNDVAPAAIGTMNNNIGSAFFGLGLFIGGRLIDNTGASVESLQTLGLARSIGYFRTSPIPAEGISDFFQKIFAGVHNLNLGTDEIIFKYRKLARFGIPTASCALTWISSTQFTVDTTLNDFKVALEGDEVEIIRGAGAGQMSQISDISKSGNTWTVTLEDAILGPVAADIGYCIVDNWITLAPTITNANETAGDLFAEVATNPESAGGALEFKVILQGIDLMLRYTDFIQDQNVKAE